MAEAAQDFKFVPFDINFAEGGEAVGLDERVQGGDFDLKGIIPVDAGKARIGTDLIGPGGGEGGDGGGAMADEKGARAGFCAEGLCQEGDFGIGAVQTAEQGGEGGLGFDGNDPRLEAAQRTGMVPRVGSDVEAEIAWF